VRFAARDGASRSTDAPHAGLPGASMPSPAAGGSPNHDRGGGAASAPNAANATNAANGASGAYGTSGSAGPTDPDAISLPVGRLEDLELEMIRRTLDAVGGNISEASKRLGISRNTIYRKLRWNQPA
jgi:transcriptional regulator of acetoin/glycerol metabolism